MLAHRCRCCCRRCAAVAAVAVSSAPLLSWQPEATAACCALLIQEPAGQCACAARAVYVREPKPVIGKTDTATHRQPVVNCVRRQLPLALCVRVYACVSECERGTEHRAGRVLERVSAVVCSCCRRRCRCHRRRQRRHLSAARTIFVGSKRKPNSRQAFPSANSHIQELKPKRHSSGPAATATATATAT